MTCAGKTEAMPSDTYFRKIQRTVEREWGKSVEFRHLTDKHESLSVF